MKTLILIRHAKSSWDSTAETDFARPLNKRGHEDAPVMAKRLQEVVPGIDLLVSSTANRAYTTAQYFAPVFGIRFNHIIAKDELYHASPEVLLQTVKGLPNAANTVAIFSHNPGISYFANSLSNFNIIDMPTCGIFIVQAAIDTWEQFSIGVNSHVAFLFPKQL